MIIAFVGALLQYYVLQAHTTIILAELTTVPSEL